MEGMALPAPSSPAAIIEETDRQCQHFHVLVGSTDPRHFSHVFPVLLPLLYQRNCEEDSTIEGVGEDPPTQPFSVLLGFKKVFIAFFLFTCYWVLMPPYPILCGTGDQI